MEGETTLELRQKEGEGKWMACLCLDEQADLETCWNSPSQFYSCAKGDERIMLLNDILLNCSAINHLGVAVLSVVFAHNFLPFL